MIELIKKIKSILKKKKEIRVKYQNDYFLFPLNERIKIKEEKKKKWKYKSLIKIDKKPHKRKYEYPKYENNDDIHLSTKKSLVLKKKLG